MHGSIQGAVVDGDWGKLHQIDLGLLVPGISSTSRLFRRSDTETSAKRHKNTPSTLEYSVLAYGIRTVRIPHTIQYFVPKVPYEFCKDFPDRLPTAPCLIS